MTEALITKLEVTQEDRDAAAQFRPYCGETARGEHDGHGLVQAFAKHRLQAVRSLQARNEWQPIETAPKDETSVDLWIESEKFGWRIPHAWWCPGDEAWVTGHANYGEPGPCLGPMDVATHWRALPEAPRHLLKDIR